MGCCAACLAGACLCGACHISSLAGAFAYQLSCSHLRLLILTERSPWIVTRHLGLFYALAHVNDDRKLRLNSSVRPFCIVSTQQLSCVFPHTFRKRALDSATASPQLNALARQREIGSLLQAVKSEGGQHFEEPLFSWLLGSDYLAWRVARNHKETSIALQKA